jgi:hypothetical protein
MKLVVYLVLSIGLLVTIAYESIGRIDNIITFGIQIGLLLVLMYGMYRELRILRPAQTGGNLETSAGDVGKKKKIGYAMLAPIVIVGLMVLLHGFCYVACADWGGLATLVLLGAVGAVATLIEVGLLVLRYRYFKEKWVLYVLVAVITIVLVWALFALSDYIRYQER